MVKTKKVNKTFRRVKKWNDKGWGGKFVQKSRRHSVYSTQFVPSRNDVVAFKDKPRRKIVRNFPIHQSGLDRLEREHSRSMRRLSGVRKAMKAILKQPYSSALEQRQVRLERLERHLVKRLEYLDDNLGPQYYVPRHVQK